MTTLPPEMLPIAIDGDAEVIVCRGAPACENSACAPCLACIRVGAGGARAVAQALNEIKVRH